MKIYFFTIFISIFLTGTICKAQESKPKFTFCDIKERNIPAELLFQTLENGCDKIGFTDADGNILTITAYVFAHSPKDGGNAYFEQVTGNNITPTIKEKLKTVKPGDLFIFTNVECIKPNETKGLLSGAEYFISE